VVLGGSRDLTGRLVLPSLPHLNEAASSARSWASSGQPGRVGRRGIPAPGTGADGRAPGRARRPRRARLLACSRPPSYRVAVLGEETRPDPRGPSARTYTACARRAPRGPAPDRPLPRGLPAPDPPPHRGEESAAFPPRPDGRVSSHCGALRTHPVSWRVDQLDGGHTRGVDFPDLMFAVVGVGALLASLLPRVLEGRPFSLPIVFLALGLLLGSLPFLPVDASPAGHTSFLEHFTEVVVIIAIMGGRARPRPHDRVAPLAEHLAAAGGDDAPDHRGRCPARLVGSRAG
jgi:hypothetical protein